MEQHFILPGQEIINGEIRAHYSYGEPVDGRYYLSCILKYGIVGTEKEFFKIPKSPFGEVSQHSPSLPDIDDPWFKPGVAVLFTCPSHQ